MDLALPSQTRRLDWCLPITPAPSQNLCTAVWTCTLVRQWQKQIWRSASSASRYGTFVFKCCEGYECEQAGLNACCCKHLKSIRQTHGCNTDVFHSEEVGKKQPNKQKPTTFQLVLFETILFIPFSSVSKHLWWGHRFGKKTKQPTSQMMVNKQEWKKKHKCCKWYHVTSSFVIKCHFMIIVHNSKKYRWLKINISANLSHKNVWNSKWQL